ncbi:MAG TPA: hypothetical protein VJM10_00175, partial [Candidatus Methylomirabilis sp.]|nr:hypothetical protein [Candidatus Methylomirabilis sp.]
TPVSCAHHCSTTKRSNAQQGTISVPEFPALRTMGIQHRCGDRLDMLWPEIPRGFLLKSV